MRRKNNRGTVNYDLPLGDDYRQYILKMLAETSENACPSSIPGGSAYASVAQQAEHRFHKAQVPGPNPGGGTFYPAKAIGNWRLVSCIIVTDPIQPE